MMQESSRLNITPFIQVNYDAQACYNRIIPEVAFQLSYKYGVNKKIIELVQKAMSETKYFIKIGNTITDQFYTNTSEYKLFGTGQGSGFSPHIWTLLSNELFQIYSEYSSGFEFNPPYSTSSSQIHITAYVDDVNTHHTFPSKSTIQTMIQKASISAQRWHDLLYISGGQLSSTKCNVYAVKWEFASTSRSKVNTQLHPPMLITDSRGKPFVIHNKKTDNSHKSLGYLQSMALTKLYQKEKIESIIQQLSQVLKLMELDYTQVRIYYHTIFSPKIQYAAQLTSLAKPIITRMITQTNILALQKMGYSSATPKGVTFGHRSFAGLELIDPYVYQGAQNITNLMRSLQKDHPNALLVKNTYLWWMYQDGRSQCPLRDPHSIDSITDSIWFTELKVFLQEYYLTLHLNIPLPPLQRSKDQYIMDLVYDRDYPKKTISNINQCRMYLQVLSVSDITTVEGTYIEDTCYEHKSAKRRPHILFRHEKPKLNKSVWHYWTTFLSTLTHLGSRWLRVPLGEWTVLQPEMRPAFHTYRDQENVYSFEKAQIHRTHLQTHHKEAVSQLPPHVIPCINSFCKIYPQDFMRAALTKYNQTNQVQTSDHTLPEEIIIYTDASIQNQISAIAWVVINKQGKIIRQHQQCLTETNISLYRAEAIGVCAALRTLYTSITEQNIKWKLLCDNKSVVSRMVSLQKRVYNSEWLDFDVLQSIMDHIPKNGTFHHIKGHQLMTATSPIDVKMNTYVDSLAKSAIKDPPEDFSFQAAIRLKGGDKSLFSTTNVVQFCQKQVSLAMWRSRFGELTCETVDWNIFNQLCYTFKNQMTIIKLFSEITPTRHRQHKIQQYPTDKCPLCQIEVEDYHHVLFCANNPERLQLHCIKLERQLKSFGDISDFVKRMIYNIEHKVTNTHDTNNIQTTIGWQEIIQGKISKQLVTSIIPLMKKDNTHIKFVLKIITFLVIQWKKTWIYRIHQKEMEEAKISNQVIQEQNITKLTFLYQHRHSLNKQNQQYLCNNLQAHLLKSHSQINTWINLHYSSMITSMKESASNPSKTPTENMDPLIPC